MFRFTNGTNYPPLTRCGISGGNSMISNMASASNLPNVDYLPSFYAGIIGLSGVWLTCDIVRAVFDNDVAGGLRSMTATGSTSFWL